VSEGYDVRLASALKEEGYDYTRMTRLIRAGELIRIRHGAYAATAADDALMEHRRLIAATLPRCGDVCLSHASAAVLHCLPTWAADLDRVHATKWGGGHGRRGRTLHLHASALDADEVVGIGGLPVTCLARTVVDCARTYPYDKAVPIGDAALRAGLPQEELERGLQRARNRTGISRARSVAASLDGRAESVGESRSRIIFSRIGVPMPELQFEIIDWDGRRVARTDFGWESQRTVGEFDGKIKYGRLIGPGEKPEDAVFREKIREDRIRDLGWEVVRWTWSDLEEPQLLAARLRRAFSRGLRRPT
jgi:hypothetical protein